MPMMHIPERLATALHDRYDLQREIGRGGMATVYLARDVKHNREVAVKVLREDLAAWLGTARFLQEIAIAARLNHPHILPLLDSDDVQGVLLYVMPFIDGESLRELMNRRGRLDADRAVGITRQVGSALSYAHEQGIVHRDIKPENILLSHGHAVVSDFGIAKAISTAGGIQLTRTGFPMGTPGYMSPEQAAGMTDLDARTDVYSLACVLYEMLVGEPPGLWLTEEAVRIGRFADASEAHRQRLDALPTTMEQAMVGALAMRVDQRIPTPGEFVDALSRQAVSRRRYDDGEVKQIVRRAANLEASAPTAGGAMTIGGIERLGAEVGIPPEHVQDAASEISRRGDPTFGERVAGAPTAVVVERVIDRLISEDEFVLLVEEVRLKIGNVGLTSTLGKSLTWRSMNNPGQGRNVALTISPRGRQTRLRIEEGFGPVAGGLFGGICGGMGGGGGAAALGIGASIGSPLLAVGAAGILVVGSFGLARTLYRGHVRRRTREHEELLNRLVRYLEENR